VITAAVVIGMSLITMQTTATAGELPSGAHRIGVLYGDKLLVKEGNLFAPWTEQLGGVRKFEIAGDRIGVLTMDDKLLVKEGTLWSGWVEQAAGLKDFRMTANRIGALRLDGSVAVKEGDLYANWVEQTSGVKDLELTSTRVGVVYDNGLASVKEGSLYSPWVDQIGGVADLELSADRVGVLRTDGSVAVKETNLYTGWTEQASGVRHLELSGSYIGIVLDNGVASVKAGNLYASWVNQLGDVQSLQIAGDRIGVLRTNGSVVVKDGGLYGSWTEQISDTSQLRLAAPPAASAGRHVSAADLVNIYGSAYATDTVAAGIPSLNEQMEAAGITSPTRKAAWVATLKHESGFRYNAGEAGNADRWRGRGFIQLTGDFNYQAATNYFGHDFMSHPEDAASIEWSARIARWYWTVQRNINASADVYDMGGVGRAIGYHPRLDPTEALNRCASYKRALAYFNGGSLPVPESSIKCLR
jgi:predicted chitinase